MLLSVNQATVFWNFNYLRHCSRRASGLVLTPLRPDHRQTKPMATPTVEGVLLQALSHICIRRN